MTSENRGTWNGPLDARLHKESAPPYDNLSSSDDID